MRWPNWTLRLADSRNLTNRSKIACEKSKNMDVHDIVYIDVPRFESLASQRMSGLTQITTISEVVQRGKGSTSESGARAIQEGSGHQVGSTREVKNLDNSFREFLEKLNSDILDITSSTPKDARAACEAAISSGQFVLARGPFFYNDFKWLRSLTDIWLKWQKVNHEANPPTKEQRLEAEATKKSIIVSWALSDFAFGDSIECGVALGQSENGLLVKAVLDRVHMRLTSEGIIGRFGTKTHCHFTVLGTVARVGWHDDVTIIENLTAVLDEDTQAFKKSIEGVQEMAVNIRRNMDGGDRHSVHLMPLAVYRTSTLQDPKEPEARAVRE
ncbi:hypothetical protein WME75_01370 [Sorangium sp. So ce1014]|uniref:DUF6414 family protein n=1 Tax=Sorangium sp. So ce1014 TaxID=3133326 RepID=UPI003F5FC6CF